MVPSTGRFVIIALTLSKQSFHRRLSWQRAMFSTHGHRRDTTTADLVLFGSITRMDPSRCHYNWSVWKDYITARRTLLTKPRNPTRGSIALPYPSSKPTSDCLHSTAPRQKANNSNRSCGFYDSVPPAYSNLTISRAMPPASRRHLITTPFVLLTSRNRRESESRRSSARPSGLMNADVASTWTSGFYGLPPPTSNNLVQKGAIGWSSHTTDTPLTY